MSATAKIIIKGENQLSPAVKSAQGDMNGLSQSVQKFGTALKSAFAITAVIAALKELGTAAKQCFSDFTTAERSYRQLALAIQDTSAYEQAVKTINTLSRQTLSSKEDIESMVAELAALGKSGDEIEKIATAAVALSNVTGKDLNSSMTTLLNTYNGTTTALNKLGINTADLTKEELAQGEAVQLVIDKLGDYSIAMAQADSSQHIQNIKNTWGDIRQVIGGVIDYNFKDLFDKFDKGLSNSYGNIVNIIQYIGAVIKNFPQVARIALNTVWELVKKTFEWDSLKQIFITVAENIYTIMITALKAIFVSIPKMIWDVVKGIGLYVAYIGVNIKNSILGAVEDLLNFIPSHLPAWMKKLLGMDDDGRVFDFKIDRDSADNLKKMADESFASAGSGLVDTIHDALEARATTRENTAETMEALYGGIITDFKNAVDAVVEPTLAEIKEYTDASNQSKILNGKEGGNGGSGNGGLDDAIDTVTDSVEKVNEVVRRYRGLLDYGLTDLEKEQKVLNTLINELQNGTLTEEERATLEAEIAAQDKKILDIKDKETKAIQANLKAVEDWRKSIQASNEEALHPFTTTMNSLFGKGGRFSKSYWSTEEYTDDFGNVHTQQKFNMGGSEANLWSELSGVISDVLSEFSSFVDAIISGCWWLAILIEIAKGFATEIKPFLAQVLNPIKDLLQQFGAALARASVFEELIQIVQMLLPVVRSVMNIITPLVSILTTLTRIATQTLMPILKGLAYVLITITGTFEWVIAWFKYWIDSFCNWLASIDILGWKPFDGLQRTATKPSNYGEFMSGKYAAIDAGADTTYDASAATSVSNASYTGATSVTINIYQQAPVVGTGGMLEFAQLIRDAFEQLDYYSISA